MQNCMSDIYNILNLTKQKSEPKAVPNFTFPWLGLAKAANFQRTFLRVCFGVSLVLQGLYLYFSA